MKMKEFRTTVLMGLSLAAAGLMQGCFLALLGAAGGAAYGTTRYVGNTLEVDQPASLDQTWQAANTALAELMIPASAARKDAAYGRLESHNAQGQPVTVELRRKTDRVTQIRITVGTFDSTENRAAAQQIYDKIKPLSEPNPPAKKPV
jgi:hypothetical protein